MKNLYITALFSLFLLQAKAQNYTFDFSNNGQRVCLAEAKADTTNQKIKIVLLDSADNSSYSSYIYRRALGSYSWTLVANGLAAGTGHWIDSDVQRGDAWEYQIRRKNSWTYSGTKYDAIGYTNGSLLADNTAYKGQMILLAASDITTTLASKYTRLKKELTADGWYVNELIVSRGSSSWDDGSKVVTIKNQIKAIYSAAPSGDKPKCLFILGHVPLPRSGIGTVMSPDGHDEHKGARGCDAYYADMDGTFTDVSTYSSSTVKSDLQKNSAGDYKWDQEYFPSDIEMAFGRIDFADITSSGYSETVMMGYYLDQLDNYKNAGSTYLMGDKSAYFFGYDNSNDGTFRSLPGLSMSKNIYQLSSSDNPPQWVKNNGPFKVFMQNKLVPDIDQWKTYGMNATIYSSDQSSWGYGDVPESGYYSLIRSLLGLNTRCLAILWTTSAVNEIHQAASGIPIGLAIKTIMNSNATNKYIERPPQDYEDENWWNRTHLAFFGDPTFTLYQVSPPSSLTLTAVDGKARLNWTASSDTKLAGYHIYESTSELGIYTRVTSTPVKATSYTLNSYTYGNWYMVKAVKNTESGGGIFLQPSLGINIQGTIKLTGTDIITTDTSVIIKPNPVHDKLTISSPREITKICFYDVNGKQVFNQSVNHQTDIELNTSTLSANLYICKIYFADHSTGNYKVVKN